MALRDSPSCERERESKVRYDVLKLISYLSTVQLGIDLFDLSLLSLFHKKYSPSLILSRSCSLSLLTLAQALLLSALQPAPPTPTPPHYPPTHTHGATQQELSMVQGTMGRLSAQSQALWIASHYGESQMESRSRVPDMHL